MNTKLKCLLLDDELPRLTYLKLLCEQIPELEVVKAYNNPQKFLEEWPSLDFDLCILDIEMPVMNGLQVANLMKGKPVIFTTAYREYAAEAFDLEAIDYIRKPIQKERLIQAVNKARTFLGTKGEKKQFIQFNTDKGKSILFFDQILYIKTAERDSRDKEALMADGTSLLLKNITFNQLTEQLPKRLFVRINKQEILALKAVQFFSYDEITTNIPVASGGNLKLTLGDSFRDEFIQKLKV